MANYDSIGVFADGSDVIRRLQGLSRKLAGKIVRPALRAGARPIHAEAKANVDNDNAPEWEDTGRTKRAIKIRAGKRRRGQIQVKVTVGKGWWTGPTFYAAFREFGHKIGKRASGARGQEQAAFAAKKDTRNEVRPYKFMEPAFKSKGAEAAKIVERAVVAGIEREAPRG